MCRLRRLFRGRCGLDVGLLDGVFFAVSFCGRLGGDGLGAAVLGAIELFILVWILIVPDILVLEDWLVAKILSLVTVLALAALLSKVPLAFFDLAVFLDGAIMSSALVYNSFSSSQVTWMFRISKTFVRAKMKLFFIFVHRKIITLSWWDSNSFLTELCVTTILLFSFYLKNSNGVAVVGVKYSTP